MRSLTALSLLPILASASPVLNVQTIHNDASPIISSYNAKEVPNSYIVVFKDHVSPASATEHHTWVQDLHLSSVKTQTELRKRSQIPIVSDIFNGLKHTYHVGDILGYSGNFDEEVIEKIRKHPDVSVMSRASMLRLLITA